MKTIQTIKMTIMSEAPPISNADSFFALQGNASLHFLH